MPMIQLDRVTVSFPIYSASSRLLTTQVISVGTGGRIGLDANKRVGIQAIDNVSMRLEEGDRLALIGHNGAGKTTMLRVLAGIYEPSIGEMAVDGKTIPFFDLGLGMDPESTGYENILLRGLYLGLPRREIRRKTEEIAAFTELGAFLEMPLRTYSAGMHTRLAFAVATSVEPEILLIDEGIGAGDAAFVEKAKRRLDAFIARAGILVLASHNDDLIRRMCNKALLLEHGRVLASGSVEDVLARYNAGR
jgi:ABC-2 type transport system ATP-binding protein/lipopolysaccharide transport system ATP-binding protein